MIKPTWTPEEDEVLKKLYPTNTCQEISPILKRSVFGVMKRAIRLRLKKDETFWPIQRKQARRSRTWTIEQVEHLKNHYATDTNDELLSQLGNERGLVAIRVKAFQLGLKRRSPAFIEFIHAKPIFLSEFYSGWIAALTDGEGQIGLYCYQERFDIGIVISNTNKEILDMAYSVLGIGYVYSYQTKRSKDKRCWHFKTHGWSETYVLALILKGHLIVKRKQLDTLFKFFDLWKRENLEGVDLKIEKLSLVKQMYELNKRGVENGVKV